MPRPLEPCNSGSAGIEPTPETLAVTEPPPPPKEYVPREAAPECSTKLVLIAAVSVYAMAPDTIGF